jgi:hypothetical protein
MHERRVSRSATCDPAMHRPGPRPRPTWAYSSAVDSPHARRWLLFWIGLITRRDGEKTEAENSS